MAGGSVGWSGAREGQDWEAGDKEVWGELCGRPYSRGIVSHDSPTKGQSLQRSIEQPEGQRTPAGDSRPLSSPRQGGPMNGAAVAGDTETRKGSLSPRLIQPLSLLDGWPVSSRH